MKSAEEAIARASELKNDHAHTLVMRARVRAIMNGGIGAVQALLGPHIKDEDLPWANLMLSGLTRLSQKLGRRPDIRVDMPPATDSEPARERAEKKERIVESYDHADRLPLQLPQVARWIPGYGFAVWTIGTRKSAEGIPYPKAELRDPFDCFPSAWGVDQAPDELAIWRRITPEKAKKLYPEFTGKIDRRGGQGTGAFHGAVLLGGEGQWSNPSRRGLSLVEFYDIDGIHVLIPEISEKVDFIPNVLSTPPFVVPKRFAFDALIGQYDQMIGLMGAMAKMNIFSVIAMQDAVFTETNIIGAKPLGGQYRKGRVATNVFPPGTIIDKPTSNMPYQLFEQINRIERQARLVAGYPIQDDAQSPLSFATGEGLEELKTGTNNEVKEYQLVLEWALADLDAKRLEYDEVVSGRRRKPLAGQRRGVPFAETYIPATHIKGDYRTRRTYGAMAGWDDSAKIVGGLQLLSADVIDVMTMRENIDGLDNLTKIEERVTYNKMSAALNDVLVAAAQNGDGRAVMAMIERLPPGTEKTTLQKYFTPEEPQLSPAEEEFLGGGQAAGLEALAGQGGLPPDVATVLSRLTGAGATQGGVQTVARV